MSKTLVIYNMVPDATKYYMVPSDHEDINLIKGAHGVFINVIDPTPEQQIGIDYINDASSSNEDYCKNVADVGKLIQYEVEEISLLDTPVDGVVVASFYM
jgi:hypothetical protein